MPKRASRRAIALPTAERDTFMRLDAAANPPASTTATNVGISVNASITVSLCPWWNRSGKLDSGTSLAFGKAHALTLRAAPAELGRRQCAGDLSTPSGKYDRNGSRRFQTPQAHSR